MSTCLSGARDDRRRRVSLGIRSSADRDPRGVMAALLPLSADEAYYWLWSKHLAAGYFDHPPAIAWLIRAGTVLFGDTPFGVRVAASAVACRQAGLSGARPRSILKDEDRAALAALLFNLTLMATVELLAATPDMPSVVTLPALSICLARVQATRQGRLLAGRRHRGGPWPAVEIFDAVSGRRRLSLACARPRCAPLAHDALALGGRACWRLRSSRPICCGSRGITGKLSPSSSAGPAAAISPCASWANSSPRSLAWPRR